MVLVFLLNLALLGYHSREAFANLFGLEDRDTFLLKRERSYGMAKFVNENLPPDVKILNSEEVRMFYFNRDLVRESLYRRRTKYGESRDLNETLKRLKKDGFTHLLIVDRDKDESKEGIRKWIDPHSQEKNLKEIHRTHFQERDGHRLEYVLYSLT